jgi:hypothetical protein
MSIAMSAVSAASTNAMPASSPATETVMRRTLGPKAIPSRVPAVKPGTSSATTRPGLPIWSATYGTTIKTLLT